MGLEQWIVVGDCDICVGVLGIVYRNVRSEILNRILCVNDHLKRNYSQLFF